MPGQRLLMLASAVVISCAMLVAMVLSQEVRVEPQSIVTATETASSTTVRVPLSKMSPYMRRCADSRVPLPPKWGDPAWRLEGTLAEVFISKELVAEVWTYSNSLGICFALPRKDAAGKIELLGIICQSKSPSKACFWDNLLPNSDTRIVGADVVGMDPADIQDGDALSENCTQCHRGENVFLIYPGTALHRVPWHQGQPYEPISNQSGWINEAGENRCDACHSIPVLTEGYCDVLLGIIGKSADVGGWNEHAGRVREPLRADKVQVLVDECNALRKEQFVFERSY